MNSHRWTAISAITACLLVPPTLGSLKNVVERPLRITETVNWVVNLTDFTATGVGVGQGTHTGRYLNEATALWSLDSSPGGYFGIIQGEGVVTSANGDVLFWKMTPDQLGVVQLDGGTGRFEGATGALDATTLFSVSTEVQGASLILQLKYESSGAIYY